MKTKFGGFVERQSHPPSFLFGLVQPLLLHPISKMSQSTATTTTSSSSFSASSLRTFFSGIGGFNSYKVFDVSDDWQNLSLPPGYTSLASIIDLKQTLVSVANLSYFAFSPNLTWFAIAALWYLVNPYDLTASPTVASSVARFTANYALAFAYTFYFYYYLYVDVKSSRKLFPGSTPSAGNMAHNLWYWSLGVVQWTLYEALQQKLWSASPSYSPVLPPTYSASYVLVNVATILLIPLWRDIHFYTAHRFLHIRPLYNLVHSLHHRNTDPEPFSGLSMHPVEHLYYYSNALLPALLARDLFHPLTYTFIFLHLTLAPAAGHSGYVDHFGSDQYHAIHHAKFEANYGSPSSAFLDRFFGTFRETMGNKSGEYRGELTEREIKKDKVWSSTGHLGLWESKGRGVYDTSMLVIALVCVYAVSAGGFESNVAHAVAAAVSLGPIGIAIIVNKLGGDKMPLLWPFHKERIGILYTIVTGGMFCVAPVYWAVLEGARC
jgi:sterol desaturase/sphingolipid hydroxylase (fatty acid hydroxylase superfamily)